MPRSNGRCVDYVSLSDPAIGVSEAISYCGITLPESKFETTENSLDVFYSAKNIGTGSDFKLLINIKKKEGLWKFFLLLLRVKCRFLGDNACNTL